jgi:hypothetical protein
MVYDALPEAGRSIRRDKTFLIRKKSERQPFPIADDMLTLL